MPWLSARAPGLIKYPFWEYTGANPLATYACINFGEATAPLEIEKQAVLIDDDIDKVLTYLTNVR